MRNLQKRTASQAAEIVHEIVLHTFGMGIDVVIECQIESGIAQFRTHAQRWNLDYKAYHGQPQSKRFAGHMFQFKWIHAGILGMKQNDVVKLGIKLCYAKCPDLRDKAWARYRLTAECRSYMLLTHCRRRFIDAFFW